MTAAKRPLNQRLSFWLSLLIIVILLGLYNQYQLIIGKSKKQSSPVTLATAKTRAVPLFLSGLGTVTPTYSVTVKTQVNGQLLQVLFKEGQDVKKGQLLAQVDPRPYEAQLTQYEGQLERDKALLANALIDLKRYETLWKQDSVSQQTLATQQSLVQQYEGAVRADQGLIQTVQVNLIYCRITSPIDGRIGLRLVDAGNIVQTTDTTGIAVINTLNPITVVFTLPEDNIPEVMEQVGSGATLTTEAYDRQQNKLLATGVLLAVDSQIDTTTGTVKLKAQFNNKKALLFPNQFVNVKLLVRTFNNATTVPTAAIQYGTKGTFVYRLNEDFTVSATPVAVGLTTGDDSIITQGLVPGHLVVTEGADKLTNGTKVTIPDSIRLATQNTHRYSWRNLQLYFRRWMA